MFYYLGISILGDKEIKETENRNKVSPESQGDNTLYENNDVINEGVRSD